VPTPGESVRSAKLSAEERRRSLFPYYAGFSGGFVSDVVRSLGLGGEHTILDPWNGSGTTTAVASGLGIASIGIDLNPALLIVAKARQATRRDISAALSQVASCSKKKLSRDLLREICVEPLRSSVRSLILVAVFRLVRRRLKAKSLLSTNPTWWRFSNIEVRRAVAAISLPQLATELRVMGEFFGVRPAERGTVRLLNSDLLTAPLQGNSVDAIVTSPPYLTRIDYVKATLPELTVLQLLTEVDIEGMRYSMIGSPVVESGVDRMPIDVGPYARQLLGAIIAHASKASGTYYAAFFGTYVAKMVAAFERLRRACKPSANMVLVVQGSHYKEIYVDLPLLCIELAAVSGFNLTQRLDHRFRQSFAQFNPRANGYPEDKASESILFFNCQK
jgi:DNA modification methylase